MSAENDQDDPWLRFEHLLVGEPLPANPIAASVRVASSIPGDTANRGRSATEADRPCLAGAVSRPRAGRG